MMPGVISYLETIYSTRGEVHRLHLHAHAIVNTSPGHAQIGICGGLDPPTLANGGMTAFDYRILNVARQTSSVLSGLHFCPGAVRQFYNSIACCQLWPDEKGLH